MAGVFEQVRVVASLRKANVVMVDGPNVLAIMHDVGAVCGIQRLGRWVAFSYREGTGDALTFTRSERAVRQDLKRLADLHERQQANPLTHIGAAEEELAFRKAGLPWWGLNCSPSE